VARCRVYAADGSPLRVRGFYLFVAQENMPDGRSTLTALALCDGDLLNADFYLYLSIVSRREKLVGLGTYANGVNRQRPMLIFANPLGARELDRSATLVTGRTDDGRVQRVYHIVRTAVGGSPMYFDAYRQVRDVPAGWEVQALTDPFPVPKNRAVQTQAWGRFRLPFNVQ